MRHGRDMKVSLAPAHLDGKYVVSPILVINASPGKTIAVGSGLLAQPLRIGGRADSAAANVNAILEITPHHVGVPGRAEGIVVKSHYITVLAMVHPALFEIVATP